MPHRDIQQRDQKTKACDQPAFEPRGLGVLERGLVQVGAGRSRAVAGRRNGVKDRRVDGVGVGAGGIVHLHGVGQQADRDAAHTRHRRDRPLHMRAACRAAHTGHRKTLHEIPPGARPKGRGENENEKLRWIGGLRPPREIMVRRLSMVEDRRGGHLPARGCSRHGGVPGASEDAAPYGWRQTRLPPCKANDEPNHHA